MSQLIQHSTRLYSCAADGINLAGNAQVQELVTDLNLQTSDQRFVNLSRKDNLSLSSQFTFDGLADGLRLGLSKGVCADNGCLYFSTGGLHELFVDTDYLLELGQTSVASHGGEEVEGDRSSCSAEQSVQSGGLVISANNGIIQKILQTRMLLSCSQKALKLSRNGIQYALFGSSYIGSIGISRVNAVKFDRGLMGSGTECPGGQLTGCYF
mmetsp:Transcript_22198/g.33319  ORF Transcript_22198/g.33319 Transcript_22198/m.33319 type:complete len:211 (-) Transcript_22198:38-670(-)